MVLNSASFYITNDPSSATAFAEPGASISRSISPVSSFSLL
jgi:hypothetical protein